MKCTCSSVISTPVTKPSLPTSLLKTKQSRPAPLPKSNTLTPSTAVGNTKPQP